jgi:hypothetical protein
VCLREAVGAQAQVCAYARVAGKCGGAKGATNDVKTWCTRVAYWTSKATCTQAYAKALVRRAHAHAHAHKHIIFIAFLHQQCFENAPQCYVIRTFCVLFLSSHRSAEMYVKSNLRRQVAVNSFALEVFFFSERFAASVGICICKQISY